MDVSKFTVTVKKHPDADPTLAKWLVIAKVKFSSEDPSDWGEFRAFGGSWNRALRRSSKGKKKTREITGQLVTLATDIEIEDSDLSWTQRYLPLWRGPERPTRFDGGASLHLANDQHVQIFYRLAVPTIRRSDQTMETHTDANGTIRIEPRYRYEKGRYAKFADSAFHAAALATAESPLLRLDPIEDDVPSDAAVLKLQQSGTPLPKNVQPTERPEEIQFDDYWHIIMRDEPDWGGFPQDAFIEYWHQAEFRICKPNSVYAVATKRLFLRVRGCGESHRYYAYLS